MSADIQWVTWQSFFQGKHQKGKWHARIGFARKTLCSRKISPLDSIGMERLGAWRRTSPPLDKKRVCQRCMKAAEKLQEEWSMAGKFYECGECDEVFEDLEAGEAVYECSRCSQTQVGERRCETDHIFMAKISDISCPYCGAPEEDLKEVTEDRAVERLKEKEAEAMAAEKARPAQEQQRKEEMDEWRKKADEEAAPWKGDEALGNALADVIADHDHDIYGDSVGRKWNWYFGESGGTGLGISREEAEQICKKIIQLEEELEGRRSSQ